MIQVNPDLLLFIGNQEDYEKEIGNQEGWFVIHACKEPYHRRLLGYTTPGAPKDDPEYLFAERPNRLYLNLVDANRVDFIPPEIINKAIDTIDYQIKEMRKVFIHCNLGESRAPSIALLYLYKTGKLKRDSSSLVLLEFTKFYPDYNPGQGMLDYVINEIENINREGVS